MICLIELLEFIKQLIKINVRPILRAVEFIIRLALEEIDFNTGYLENWN